MKGEDSISNSFLGILNGMFDIKSLGFERWRFNTRLLPYERWSRNSKCDSSKILRLMNHEFFCMDLLWFHVRNYQTPLIHVNIILLEKVTWNFLPWPRFWIGEFFFCFIIKNAFHKNNIVFAEHMIISIGARLIEWKSPVSGKINSNFSNFF